MNTKELIEFVERETGLIVQPRTKAAALETLRKHRIRVARFEAKIAEHRC